MICISIKLITVSINLLNTISFYQNSSPSQSSSHTETVAENNRASSLIVPNNAENNNDVGFIKFSLRYKLCYIFVSCVSF